MLVRFGSNSLSDSLYRVIGERLFSPRLRRADAERSEYLGEADAVSVELFKRQTGASAAICAVESPDQEVFRYSELVIKCGGRGKSFQLLIRACGKDNSGDCRLSACAEKEGQGFYLPRIKNSACCQKVVEVEISDCLSPVINLSQRAQVVSERR